jgi:transcriptional regulator with XRE-family HTH domain
MTGKEFAALRRKKKYSQEQVRHALARGVTITGGETLRIVSAEGGPLSRRMIQAWEQDINTISEVAAIVIRLLPDNAEPMRGPGSLPGYFGGRKAQLKKKGKT